MLASHKTAGMVSPERCILQHQRRTAVGQQGAHRKADALFSCAQNHINHITGQQDSIRVQLARRRKARIKQDE